MTPVCDDAGKNEVADFIAADSTTGAGIRDSCKSCKGNDSVVGVSLC